MEQLGQKDLRLRVTPVENVCGQGSGYSVDVLVLSSEGGRSVLRKVKSYSVVEKISFFNDTFEIVNCQK